MDLEERFTSLESEIALTKNLIDTTSTDILVQLEEALSLEDYVSQAVTKFNAYRDRLLQQLIKDEEESLRQGLKLTSLSYLHEFGMNLMFDSLLFVLFNPSERVFYKNELTVLEKMFYYHLFDSRFCIRKVETNDQVVQLDELYSTRNKSTQVHFVTMNRVLVQNATDLCLYDSKLRLLIKRVTVREGYSIRKVRIHKESHILVSLLKDIHRYAFLFDSSMHFISQVKLSDPSISIWLGESHLICHSAIDFMQKILYSYEDEFKTPILINYSDYDDGNGEYYLSSIKAYMHHSQTLLFDLFLRGDTVKRRLEFRRLDDKQRLSYIDFDYDCQLWRVLVDQEENVYILAWNRVDDFYKQSLYLYCFSGHGELLFVRPDVSMLSGEVNLVASRRWALLEFLLDNSNRVVTFF